MFEKEAAEIVSASSRNKLCENGIFSVVSGKRFLKRKRWNIPCPIRREQREGAQFGEGVLRVGTESSKLPLFAAVVCGSDT